MSDISDVQVILANLIDAAMYPNGNDQPSVTGSDIRIYPGWPDSSSLDADLLVNIAHISIFPNGVESNVSRYPRDWRSASVVTSTLTATLEGQTIVIGGSVNSPFSPLNVAVLVDKQPYVYSVQQADALTDVAAGLAALIPGASVTGPVISVPPTASINAIRIGSTGISIRELKRQKKTIQITVWASTPQQRDLISAALDVGLSGSDFLSMPDGYAARLIYEKSLTEDGLQKAKLYRREFFYSVEYATTQTRTDYAVVALTLTAGVQTSDPARYAPAVVTNY